MTAPKLNSRQQLLVTLLQEAGGEAPRICFMKWLFLLAQETSWGTAHCPYDFVPYRYGPFSFMAYHDIRKLEAQGVVHQTTHMVALSDSGACRPHPARQSLRVVLDEYGACSPDELMADVYERYQWYAMLTERPDLAPVVPVRELATPAVYTIGYAGRSVDSFLYALMYRDLAGVIDVRSSPRSRVYGFTATTLERNLGELKLRYVPMPELGIPSAERQDIDTRSRRAEVLVAYGEWLAETQTEAVARAADTMTRSPLALMCMESDPGDCHRGVLASAVAEATDLELVHL